MCVRERERETTRPTIYLFIGQIFVFRSYIQENSLLPSNFNDDTSSGMIILAALIGDLFRLLGP